jgi:chromate transporter
MTDKHIAGATNASEEPAVAAARVKVSLLELAVVFFRIGATTFGGLWAATKKLEDDLVRRRAWLTLEDQQTLMVAATLIPAPKFLAFGGLVGFRMQGWLGSIVSLCALIAPGALSVLVGVIVLSPEILGPPLVPVQRAVGIAIVGLLFGNAYHQLRSSKVKGPRKLVGIALAVSVAAAAILGVPLLLASVVGFAIGAVVLRRPYGEFK